MSTFSELLSGLIRQKEIKVYDLIRYCKIDRSTMYQIINGKRNPPPLETILRIADICELTPYEREELIKAADISRIGEDAYLRRKQVEMFLLHFPRRMSMFRRGDDKSFSHDKLLSSDHLHITEENHPYLPQHSCAFLENMELNIAIRRILIQEAKNKKGHIRLFLQPDTPYVFQILHGLLPIYPLTIEHLICLGNTIRHQKGTFDQFTYLENFLPVFAPPNTRYLPYYFYDSIESHYYNLNGMSCMILTSKYAILCSSDFNCGMYFSQPDFVQGLTFLFNSYLTKCSPLTETISLNMEDLSSIEKINRLLSHSQNYYFVDNFSCIVSFCTKDILERIISPSQAGRQQMIAACDTLLTACRKYLSSETRQLYFTKEGLSEFTRTGQLMDQFTDYVTPLCPEDRIHILENVKLRITEGNFHMLRPPLESLSPELSLCVCEDFVGLRFERKPHDHVCLLFREVNLLSIFLEYFENIPRSSCYTPNEAAAYINEMIQSLDMSPLEEKLSGEYNN